MPVTNKAPLQDQERKSYVDSTTRPSSTAKEVYVGNDTAIPVSSSSPFGLYDSIIATYPTTASELYTYSLSAVDIGTITVTYTNSSKSVLTSVVKVEL
mgnify:CR=1 FL=1